MEDFSAVDLASLVHMEVGTRVHILHGGAKDRVGTHQALAHLQKTWVHAAIVYVPSGKALLDLAATREARVPRGVTLLVAVPLEVVQQVPDAYDAIARHVVMVTIIGVGTLDGVAKPYSSKARIMALAVPSCRVEAGDALRTAARIYGFPAPAHKLVQALDVMDHGMCLGWHAGGVSTEPSFVDVDGRATIDSDRARDLQAQVDRAWSWTQPSALISPGPGTAISLPPDVVAVVQASSIRARVRMLDTTTFAVAPGGGVLVTPMSGVLAETPVSAHALSSEGVVFVVWLHRLREGVFQCVSPSLPPCTGPAVGVRTHDTDDDYEDLPVVGKNGAHRTSGGGGIKWKVAKPPSPHRTGRP